MLEIVDLALKQSHRVNIANLIKRSLLKIYIYLQRSKVSIIRFKIRLKA